MNGISTRLTSLDFLRGVAVLGLLLMNAPYMGQVEYGYVPAANSLLSDDILHVINVLLFDGRFRSLFCLLFGIGLYLQFNSFEKKTQEPAVILRSRLKWLLLFGLVHCIFIWPGDILIIYALSGFFVLSELNLDAEKLIRKGKIFFAIGFALLFVETFIIMLDEAPINRDSELFVAAVESTTQGYFADIWLNLAVAFFFIVSYPIFSLFYICGIMYLGIGLFKSGKLTNGFEPKTIIQLLLVTISVSILEAYLIIYHHELWFHIPGVLSSLSGLTMALLIWQLVLKTAVHQGNGILVTAIKNVGTMALSFYIFQSVVFTLLMQVVFPEWNYSFSLLNYLALTSCLILAQLIIGYFYKRYFKQGPLEYFWRQLVDRKVAKLQNTLAKQEP